jgi:hypothetical protein
MDSSPSSSHTLVDSPPVEQTTKAPQAKTKAPQAKTKGPQAKAKGPQAKAPKAPRTRRKEPRGKGRMHYEITDEKLEQIPFHDSPLFTNELLARFQPKDYEKTVFSKKFETFLRGIQLQNRVSFQKELYNAKTISERRKIVDQFISVCGENAPLSSTAMDHMSILINDTTDKNDILIMKKDGNIKGVAIVSKSLDYENSFELKILCSKEIVKGGSFMLMMYMMALNAKDMKVGSLSVDGGYSNLNALCLYDKFGFREDPEMINKYNQLMMKCDLTQVKDDRIYNTFLGKDAGLKNPWFLKKMEPMCTDRFRNLSADIQEKMFDFRENSLSNIATEKDVEKIHQTVMNRI